MATTLQQIKTMTEHIMIQAYLQGLTDSTMPMEFTPGDKKAGLAPTITRADGSVPDYLPALDSSDNNLAVLKKLEAAFHMMHVMHKFLTETCKTELVYGLETNAKFSGGYMPEYETLSDAEEAIEHYIPGYLTGRIMVKNVFTKPWTVAKEVTIV